MLELEDALGRVLAAVPAPAAERVPLGQACGRVLAEEARAGLDLPPFDNSSVDGYAVHAQDLTGATLQSPVRLRLVGKVAAGEPAPGNVGPRECVRLFTGSVLPSGANAVVMQEDTRIEAAESTEVSFLDFVKPWENVRFRGEDVRLGATLAESGRAITPGGLALLAATGYAEITVGRRPVVGLLATGSELQEPGAGLAPGQIYESNRFALAALTERVGGVPRVLPLVTDVLEPTRAALADAFRQCDAVVTSGGVSVGEMDFVKRAFQEAGGTTEFWRVAVKPGRPFVFGRWPGGKLLFGLPGNPVSAVVTFLLLVRPALLRWQGASDVSLASCPGVLVEPLSNPGDRRHFLRVKVDARGKVSSAGAQGSHMLSSLAGANGLVELPPRTNWPAGAIVQVLRPD